MNRISYRWSCYRRGHAVAAHEVPMQVVGTPSLMFDASKPINQTIHELDSRRGWLPKHATRLKECRTKNVRTYSSEPARAKRS